jgi:hypothetical protein
MSRTTNSVVSEPKIASALSLSVISLSYHHEAYGKMRDAPPTFDRVNCRWYGPQCGTVRSHNRPALSSRRYSRPGKSSVLHHLRRLGEIRRQITLGVLRDCLFRHHGKILESGTAHHRRNLSCLFQLDGRVAHRNLPSRTIGQPIQSCQHKRNAAPSSFSLRRN